VTVSIRDAKASADDRRWIAVVYPEFLDELSEATREGTGVFPVTGEHGPREGELLARWFRDDRSHPLLILKANRPVGFALVARPLIPPRAANASEFRMAEFFVRRSFRRLGVGRGAAALIFSRFAGRWEISESQRNAGAVQFWRRVVHNYTQGRFQERAVDGDIRQQFVTSNAPLLDRAR
jgi:predicted acetyltransferase